MSGEAKTSLSLPTSADSPRSLWERSQKTGESYLELMQQAGHLVKRATAKCKSCQAEIYWTRTALAGNAMPVDAVPAEDGNLVLSQRGGELVSQQFEPELHQGRRRFKSHFATCKQAAEWRRRETSSHDVDQVQQADLQAEARKSRR